MYSCTFAKLASAYMYALCVSGAVNMQGFAWKFFYFYVLYKESLFIHSIREPVWPSGKALGW